MWMWMWIWKFPSYSLQRDFPAATTSAQEPIPTSLNQHVTFVTIEWGLGVKKMKVRQ